MTDDRERTAWTRGRLRQHVAEQRAELAQMGERPTPQCVAWLVEHFRYNLDVMDDLGKTQLGARQ